MRVAAASLLLILGLVEPAGAQGLFGASPHQPSATDRTGTNPLNLQHQIDVTNAHIALDGLYLNTSTYRHAVSLWHRRVRVAGSVPFAVTNRTGQTARGLGDVGADIEWTPWLTGTGGLVTGLRSTWHTATGEGLGYGGAHTLMPYAQYVRHLSARTLVAPFVGYRVSVGGDDFAPGYADTLVGATVVWRTTERLWISSTPQVVLDWEHDRTYGDVGGEVGYQWSSHVAAWLRPTFGFGANGQKPYSWGVAVGLRVVP